MLDAWPGGRELTKPRQGPVGPRELWEGVAPAPPALSRPPGRLLANQNATFISSAPDPLARAKIVLSNPLPPTCLFSNRPLVHTHAYTPGYTCRRIVGHPRPLDSRYSSDFLGASSSTAQCQPVHCPRRSFQQGWRDGAAPDCMQPRQPVAAMLARSP